MGNTYRFEGPQDPKTTLPEPRPRGVFRGVGGVRFLVTENRVSFRFRLGGRPEVTTGRLDLTS